MYCVPRISVRIPYNQYIALKLLVEAGVYPSLSDAIREAIVKLLKESVVTATLTRRKEVSIPSYS